MTINKKLLKAQKYLRSGYYLKAIEILDKHLKILPDDTSGLMLRGEAFLRNEQFKLALIDYAKVVELDNKNILALNAQAQAHGIRVININSFAPVSNFKWPDTAVWPVDVDFFSWAADGGYAKTTAGHYYLPAHRAYADLILAELDR